MSAADVHDRAFAREREELERILTSDLFRRSKSHRLILSYVCEAYFDGREDELKEYNIAVEALGRPSSFDHRKDSIVRVEFHKLRKRLDKFYRNEGRRDEVAVEIPPGQYAPRFATPEAVVRHAAERQAEHEAASDEAPVRVRPSAAEASSKSRAKTIAWFVALGAAVAVSLFFAFSRSNSERPAVPEGAPAELVHRITVGTTQAPYVDDLGVTWTGDEQFFEGGETVTDDEAPLEDTPSPFVYRTRREGAFSYSIPLDPGLYEVRLHFAETVFGPGNPGAGEKRHGESSRIFHVDANGERILNNFDVLVDAGGANRPLEKVFAGISPGSDGVLKLDFIPLANLPILNGLEIFRTADSKMRPVRILAGREAPLVDTSGREWGPDRYVSGGRPVPRQNAIVGTDSPNLFAGERYGNFQYRIPVDPQGTYSLRLLFAEMWWGDHQQGGPGSRLFDVLLNGVKILGAFDIYDEAGGPDRAVEKVFHHIKPNPQGMIDLSFVRIENYAAVNAIEVTQE